jgi:PAS domain-containing protein
MIGKVELGALFEGLRAAVTVTDENFQITFMNDRAIEYYAEDGGAELIGTDVLECHEAEHQVIIREAYARYRAGDLTPTRYRTDAEGGRTVGIVHIPLMVEGRFRGLTELIWSERSELVFEE